MGVNNMIPPGGDDDDNSGGGGGGGPIFTGSGNGGPMVNMSQSLSDAEDMLINYNERFKDADPTLFREASIHQAVSVLIGKLKPNVLMVGEAGVGKTKIVEDIARRIVNKDPFIPDSLLGKVIYELPIASLVSGASLVGELEKRVTSLIDFASDPKNNAIIFIDEIHVLMSDRSATYEKIAQILKPALARGTMRVIGATTLSESRSFDNDPAFARRFSRLIVDELTPAQTIVILQAARNSFLEHYKFQVMVPDDVLEDITHIAGEYAKAGHHRPDNALTLLDRSMADMWLGHKAALQQAILDNDTVMVNILQAATMIQLTERRVRSTAMRLMTGNATKEELDLERMIVQLGRIKGQDAILSDLTDTLRRDTLGVFPRKTPITWMFAGASGVGKTEVSKIIAQELTNQPPIILNMTEYHSPAAINRIIGAPAGYVGSDSNAELPFDTLESNPYRVILLDEIEKADPAVQRLFLSAFDEGSIRSSQGKLIDFSKAIIVATTNAARDTLTKNPTGFGQQPNTVSPTQAALIKSLERTFDAEFLGRFSQIIAFSTMNEEIYRSIVASCYEREYARINIEQARMAALLPSSLSDADLDQLTAASYLPSQGARPAMRAVRRHIENTIVAAQQLAQAAAAARSNQLVLIKTQQAGQPARDDDGEKIPDDVPGTPVDLDVTS